MLRDHVNGGGPMVRLGDFLGAVARDKDGRIVDVDEARPGAKSHVAGDRSRDGVIDAVTAGAPPQRREGELEVCERLARTLYGSYGGWSVEQRDESDDVDCVIVVEGLVRDQLQVTQAFAAPERWSELAREGGREERLSSADVAAELLASVEAKRVQYPDDQRAGLTLVLDAVRSPAAVMASVVEAARQLEGFGQAGFASVWVVGPLERTAFRLDAES